MRPAGVFSSHVVAVLVVMALVVSFTVTFPTGATQTSDTRAVLTHAELMETSPVDVAIVDNLAFLPVGEWASAKHELQGTLTVPRMEMQQSTADYFAYRYFPGFSVAFFTHEGYLVPADSSLMVTPGNWSLVLSPGRVWSEPGDGGMSRASFPFTLGSPPDRLYTGGEAHDGVATFLFDDTHVSSLRLQITQETAPDGDIFDLWGQFPLEYQQQAIPNLPALKANFTDALSRQMPIRPWSELEGEFDSKVLESFTEGLPQEEISAAGLVFDGAIYLQPSWTRHGEYPYPRYMQHAGMSVSKSIGAGVALLWLAQEYGPEVFDLRIADYLDVTAVHDGWANVTFADVLNMATGVGDNAPDWRPFDVYANESGPNYVRFYLADTTEGKLDAAFAAGNYSWGPAELLRYTSDQTFVLSAAMDAYLKSKEGPDVQLWEQLDEHVFKPIGAYNMTMIQVPTTVSDSSVPLMASGLRLTVDDLGKIVTLLQNDGAYEGQQLLYAGKVNEALCRTGELVGLPSGKTFAHGDQAYHLSFWSLPYRTRDGRYFQVPFMSGAGGNTIFLAPNGVSTFVFTDHGQDSYSLNSPAVAATIRPFPGDGLPNVDLIPGKSLNVPLIQIIVLTWAAVTVLSFGIVFWHSSRKRRLARQSRLAWAIGTLLLGPAGLVVYLISHRDDEHLPSLTDTAQTSGG